MIVFPIMKSLAVGTVIGFIAQLMVVHLHQYHRGPVMGLNPLKSNIFFQVL